MQNKFLIFVVLLAVMGAGYAFHHRTQTTTASEHAHEEVHEDATVISAEAAAASGIETAAAGPGSIRESLPLTGRVSLNTNKTAQIKARFPGMVRAVSKNTGDMVAKGDALAKVEGNDSLLVYTVKAPLSGTILERNVSVGDVAGDAPLFVLSDLSELWAEFFIFPRDAARIHAGQPLRIRAAEGDTKVETTIAALLPVADSTTQTVVARAMLPNPENVWRAGMSLRGEVVLAEKQVPLAVATHALQRFEDGTVIFVREGNRYTARPVQTGLSDAEWTEITEGLKPGETYVSKNSFLVKADIGKAGAAHED